MTQQSKRRFIAGAVCPRCAEMDSIQLFWRDDQQCRECVSCGFFEAQNFDHGNGVTELPTRVNRPVVEAAQRQQPDDVQVVKLVGGKPDDDEDQ